MDANKVSMMYYYMADVYRRAGDTSRAIELDRNRLQLWKQWDAKLPNNPFVQRQLNSRTE